MNEKTKRNINCAFEQSKRAYKKLDKLWNGGYNNKSEVAFAAIGAFIFLPVNKKMMQNEKSLLREQGYVYYVKDADVKVYLPDIENDIMQKYMFLTDNFHDHFILKELCDKYVIGNCETH